MSEWVVLPAEMSDAAMLADIHAGAFDRGWDQPSFERFLDDKSVISLKVGDVDGQSIYGFVLARCVVEEVEILSLAVKHEMQRRGIALLLCEALIAELRGRKMLNFFLEVAEDNVAAVQLYHKLGFEHVGRRAGYYGPSGDGKRRDGLNLKLVL